MTTVDGVYSAIGLKTLCRVEHWETVRQSEWTVRQWEQRYTESLAHQTRFLCIHPLNHHRTSAVGDVKTTTADFEHSRHGQTWLACVTEGHHLGHAVKGSSLVWGPPNITSLSTACSHCSPEDTVNYLSSCS